MENSNRSFIALFLANIFLLFCLNTLNSSLGCVGIFIYIPAIFFIPAVQYLDPFRAIFLLFISGLFYDLSNDTELGFHAFILCFCYLIYQEVFSLGRKHLTVHLIILQVSLNLILVATWIIFYSIFLGNQNWTFGRICMDLVISSLAIIPIALWYPRFCESFVEFFRSNSPKLLS
jgi:hypothetical protein